MILELRKRIESEEFDSLVLNDALSGYRNPRAKITQLLRKGEIVQIKRGLYVFGEKWRQNPICVEALANLVYGPSYISMEYALSYWGLIPERVAWITSVTTKRPKEFTTPVGSFSYQHLSLVRYRIGSTLVQADKMHQAHMALPEKALADHVARQKDLTTASQLLQYLMENMRIEPEALFGLDSTRLTEIAKVYSNKQVRLLATVAGGSNA